MSLMIYTQYTKPEGTVRFDDLVVAAKKKGVKYLAMTDHGNFSGITEFYSKCLDSGIKPVIGIDLFSKLENGRYVRTIIYIKNLEGYRCAIRLTGSIKQEGRMFYCLLDDLKEISGCIFCFSMYKYDLISEKADMESDPEYVHSQTGLLKKDPGDIYFHILFDGDEKNEEISKKILTFSQKEKVNLLGVNPVYYLEKGSHRLEEMSARLYGEQCCLIQYRNQFLGATEEFIEKYSSSSIENRDKVAKSCHLLLEDMPVRFPELKLKTEISFSHFETLKEMTLKLFEEQKDSFGDIIYEELAYIRKHNIADVILFLIEIKKEFFENYENNIFFAGFVNDLHLAYIFNLTLSSPVFTAREYHRSVLSGRKILPLITVIVSPENRQGLFDYMAKRFTKDSICFLNETNKWHFISIMNSLEKEYNIPKEIVEILSKYYNKNFRSSGQFAEILKNSEVEEVLKKHPEHRESIHLASQLDDVFRNYSINTNQLVISSTNISEILPVISKSVDDGIASSFYSMNTAKHFGVWNINIESSNYPEIRKFFRLGPASVKELVKLAGELIEKIKKDDLSMIPYFNYNFQREKYLDVSDDPLMNLILYLESGRTNLSFLLNKPSPEFPGNRYKKELGLTRGFIIFREQLYFVCDKLFSAKDVVSLKRRLLDSAGIIQLNSVLNQIANIKGYSEKCEYLRSAVLPTVFYLSVSDAASKVLIGLRMLELRSKHPVEFKEYIFIREANSDEEWRKYINVMKEDGFKFTKFSVANLTKKAVSKDRTISLPLFCVKGISKKVSDYIFELMDTSQVDNFQDFIEKCDKNFIRHNTVEILVKIGFFDLFGNNRKEMVKLSEDYFKFIKKDDLTQPELFETSEIEIGTESTSDYSIEEKRDFEEEYTGLIFTRSYECDCELCECIKLKENQQIKICKSIYSEYTFALFISVQNDDDTIISELSKYLTPEGNCSINVYFSNSKSLLSMENRLELNDRTLYAIKRLLKNHPFYIEINEKRTD
ncbi:MAG TPA: PHP domain-containing protein [Clostridiales bacterium]|nr:PHP domain-containing protein [Clostridiales bacterium]HQP70917.1 PHP domain-containing protein [Clostridiales bacterium]